MAIFSKGIPRLVVLLLALAVFCLLPPETLAHGSNLGLWRSIFRFGACPACGSTHALAAFFHGRFAQSLAFNRNVVITAPSPPGSARQGCPTCRQKTPCLAAFQLEFRVSIE